MAYTKTVWEDLPSTNTPLSADNLNKIENELELLDGGYIEESGSNANGNYIKYSDGTMICTKKVTGTANITEQYYGSFYHTPDGQYFDLGDYAQEFIDIPVLNVTFYGANAQWIGAIQDVDKLHIGKLHLLAPTSKTAGAYYNVIAIGKWR